jgi:hypothetical protein
MSQQIELKSAIENRDIAAILQTAADQSEAGADYNFRRQRIRIPEMVLFGSGRNP